jgi:RNA polymerase sigma-70 factor (ECF subfamily)
MSRAHLLFRLRAMDDETELRPYLFAIAYRMLGSVADAEDVVQEAFLRYHDAGAEARAESPKAYLSTVVTRLAIDHLRSARVRREAYPGEWLPEPIVADEAAQHAETADSLSLAFLHLLEKLSPVERAVFLLREVFDYPYEDVGRIVDKSPANCRQILARAHRHVQEGRRRFEVSREQREEVARRFLAAWEEGDTEALEQVLAADVTVYGDGGGKAPSVPVPLVGADRVAKALIGWGQRALERGLRHRPAVVNGEPGVVFHDAGGQVVWVAALQIADGVVVAVRSVLNPDKLTHLPPAR